MENLSRLIIAISSYCIILTRSIKFILLAMQSMSRFLLFVFVYCTVHVYGTLLSNICQNKTRIFSSNLSTTTEFYVIEARKQAWQCLHKHV